MTSKERKTTVIFLTYYVKIGRLDLVVQLAKTLASMRVANNSQKYPYQIDKFKRNKQS